MPIAAVGPFRHVRLHSPSPPCSVPLGGAAHPKFTGNVLSCSLKPRVRTTAGVWPDRWVGYGEVLLPAHQGEQARQKILVQGIVPELPDRRLLQRLHVPELPRQSLHQRLPGAGRHGGEHLAAGAVRQRHLPVRGRPQWQRALLQSQPGHF